MNDDTLDTLDRLADEIRKLGPRDKITMARGLFDMHAAKMNEGTRRQMVAAILRMAADDVEAGR